MLDYDLLKRLCTCCGISGDEGQVRSLIINEIRPFADELSVERNGLLVIDSKLHEQTEEGSCGEGHNSKQQQQ